MKKIKIILALLLVIAVLFCVCGCKVNSPNGNEGEGVIDESADNEYTLELIGILPETISVTKAQIKAIGETKEVEYDEDDPCYASDKTDDNGDPIPHAIKGVYLDDILDLYGYNTKSSDFSAIVLKANDGYESVLTMETFNELEGGSKMIVAYHYDGEDLTESSRSGALRMVVPDQVANSWAKQLKTIIFSDAELSPPSPDTIHFIENMGNAYDGSFTREELIEGNTVDYTYYGISLSEMFDADILQAEESDKMYLTAWDYITNGTDYYYREYTNWKSYEYYSEAFLVYSEQEEEGEIIDELRAPVFDGANMLKGMSVKNVLSLSVGKDALVSLNIAFSRFDTDENEEIAFSDILELINLDTESSYSVTDTQDAVVTLTGAEMEDAVLFIDDGNYLLRYGSDSEIIIKKVEKII